MDRTSICCPSCNRHISIALRPPLILDLLPLDLDKRYLPGYKDYDLRDILYVHNELTKENKFLKEEIEKLNISLIKNRGF